MSLIQRIGIAFVAMLVLLLAGAAFFVWSTHRRFAVRVQSLQEAGKPVTVADLGEMAALRRGGKSVLRDLEKPLQSLEQTMAAAPQTDDLAKDREARMKLFRTFETTQPDLIELLRRGAEDPGAGSRLFYNVPSDSFLQSVADQIGLYRSATRALGYDAESELDGGSTDEAALDAIAILQWSDKLSHQPGLVSHLSSLAVRGGGIEIAAKCLYRDNASEQIRSQLLDTANQHDRVAAWSQLIDSERAVGLTLMDDLPGPLVLSQVFSGGAVEYLDLMQQFEVLGKQNWGVKPPAMSTDWMAALVHPSMKAALEANRRVQSQTNALLILAAWQDAGSDAGATIDDLGLPKPIVTDPFDGSTMKFKMTDDGPIIYSFGVDGADNDGDQNSDAGIAPTEY